jgi:hypothetical protein
MSKKSLDRKYATKFINESRENGKSDQEIYNELTPLYFDKKVVATFVTSVPTKQAKEKYKLYNNILLGLIAVTIIFKMLAVASIFSGNSEWLGLLFILIVPILNFYFFYAISNYEAVAYRLCGILTATSLLQSIDKLEGTANILISLALAGAITGLCYYLDDKLFPNYHPRKMEKDSNGEYIL